MLKASASPAAAALGPIKSLAQCRRSFPAAVRFSAGRPYPAAASLSSSAVRCSVVEFSAISAVAKEVEKDKGLAEKLRMGSLVEDRLSYKESFIVRCYEVGINKTATVETIANLLQEVGCNHAQSVGFGCWFCDWQSYKQLGDDEPRHQEASARK